MKKKFRESFLNSEMILPFPFSRQFCLHLRQRFGLYYFLEVWGSYLLVLKVHSWCDLGPYVLLKESN